MKIYSFSHIYNFKYKNYLFNNCVKFALEPKEIEINWGTEIKFYTNWQIMEKFFYFFFITLKKYFNLSFLLTAKKKEI